MVVIVFLYLIAKIKKSQRNMLETDTLGLGGVWIGIAPMENRFDETRIHFVEK